MKITDEMLKDAAETLKQREKTRKDISPESVLGCSLTREGDTFKLELTLVDGIDREAVENTFRKHALTMFMQEPNAQVSARMKSNDPGELTFVFSGIKPRKIVELMQFE